MRGFAATTHLAEQRWEEAEILVGKLAAAQEEGKKALEDLHA